MINSIIRNSVETIDDFLINSGISGDPNERHSRYNDEVIIEEGGLKCLASDGNLYTPDEYLKAHKQYIENPQAFYLPFENFTLNECNEPVKLTCPCSVLTYNSPYFRKGHNLVEDLSDTGYARWYMADENISDCLVIAEPGWGGGRIAWRERQCFDICQRSGADVILKTLPNQNERTRPGYKSVISYGESGGGLEISNAIIAWGKNLFDGYVPFITGANYADIIWKGDYTQRIRKDFEEMGFSQEDISKYWAVVDPQNHYDYIQGKPKFDYPSNRVAPIIAGYDTVIPTENQNELSQIFANPDNKLVLNCGHATWMIYKKRIISHIVNFINQIR